MKPSALLCSVLSTTLITTVSSQLFFPSLFSKAGRGQSPQHYAVMDPALPSSAQDNPSNTQSVVAPAVVLSDVIGKSRTINIFAGLTRNIMGVAQRLEDNAQNTTVLAPLNSAIAGLDRKPWEDPKEYKALGAQAYDGKDGADRAQSNLRRFVESHVVPVSPWREGEKVQTVAGQEVWWEKREGRKLVGFNCQGIAGLLS